MFTTVIFYKLMDYLGHHTVVPKYKSKYLKVKVRLFRK